jgi:hypothetical protein
MIKNDRSDTKQIAAMQPVAAWPPHSIDPRLNCSVERQSKHIFCEQNQHHALSGYALVAIYGVSDANGASTSNIEPNQRCPYAG